METVIRVKLNGGRLKVIYRKGISVDDLAKVEKEWPLAKSLDDLRAIFCDLAKRTGQTCSMIFESTRWNPMRIAGGRNYGVPGFQPGRRAG